MPAQSIAIVITFWVFVFWFLIEQTPSDGDAAHTAAGDVASKRALIAAAALIADSRRA